MPEEAKDANKGEDSSSSPLEGAIASSPEAVREAQEVTQTPPAEQGETQPEKVEFHEHPRFKEVIDEKNWYKQQLEQLMARQQAQAQPQQDPYAGKTPEEKVFWQEVDARAEQKVKQTLQSQVNPQIKMGIQEVARLRTELFQRDHPDIKSGSPEETLIAEKVRAGYLPEDAYKAVMYDKVMGKKQTETSQKKQEQLEAKKKASPVSPQSVSPQSTAPPKETFDEAIARKIRTENIEGF